ncbi:MAG: ABC transporter ATP-binding protein [Pseudomonadota bacterium]
MSTQGRVSNLRFFLRYLARHKLEYGVGIAFIFTTNWLAVNIPAHIGAAIDLLGETAQSEALMHSVGLVVLFALVMVVTRTISRVFFFNPGRAVEKAVKDDCFERLTQLQQDFYSQHETGTLISIVNNDINGIRTLAGIIMLQIFNVIFALSLTPLKMWEISPQLTLYCIGPVLVTFTVARYAMSYMRRQMKQRMGELQALSSNTVGFLSGIEVIKSHHIQDWAEGEFDRDNIALRDRSRKLVMVRTVYLPLIGYTDRIIKVMVLGIGGAYVIQQDLTLGELTAMLAYASLLAMPFISLGMILSALQNSIVSLESVRRILDTPPHKGDQQHLPARQRDALFSHSLRVNHLNYTYPGSSEPALCDISFAIRPGETVGVLGKIGSGKSTLVNCLNRYLEIEPGSIFLDDEDITSLSRRDLRSAVRTITQEPFLFSDSVEENIRFGADDEAEALSLEQALSESDMLEEVSQFPEAQNTLVGEKGILLSGGQKQRLSLARGLFTPSKLIILDNVLSAVDNETERFLLDQIFNTLRSQSTLIVSHRASVLARVDRILVLDRGRIVDEGRHEELLERCALYRDTWTLQQQYEEHAA